MKEATGELNMTLVTIIAIAAVLLFVSLFLPRMLNTVGNSWNNSAGNVIGGDGTQWHEGAGGSGN